MTSREGYVPVYLMDRTVIGKAKILEDGRHVEIEFHEDGPIQELIADGLIGLSIVLQAGLPAGTNGFTKENSTDG